MFRKYSYLVLLAVLTVACSTNPATGKKEFNIVSESQEVAIGQQSHQQIIEQFGVYDEKPELNRLVDSIGREIASRSERPNLPWHFTLLDTPMINAMAVPGGYIYVTRGMLENVNSVDELASVIGHEIAHVTARHSAQQISRAQLAQFGMVLGAVIAGPQAAQQYGQLAELGIGLLFQRYSRAQETQADLFGTEYMTRANYNPIGAERMLMALQRLNKTEASAIDRYFQSHPDPAKRVADVRKKIAEMPAAATSLPEPDRGRYIRMLDGIITGNSTEDVVVLEGTVYDRGHGLIVRAPSGWQATTAPGMLFAMEPNQDRTSLAFMAQEVEARELQGRNAQDAVRNRLQQIGLKYFGSREARAASGERFPIDVWVGNTQGGQVGVETTQFAHGDHVAVFLFIAPNLSRATSPLGEVIERASIDPARARSVDPPRLRIGNVRAGESWADIAQRATGNSRDAEAVANLNGFNLNQAPPTGMVIKLPEDVVPEV